MTTGILEQAPEHVPAGGGPCEYLTTGAVARRYGVSTETVGRWMTEGVYVAGGGRAILRHEKIGGHRKTTWQWVEEFRLACEGTSEPVAASTPARVDRQAAADQERLAQRLKARKRKG